VCLSHRSFASTAVLFPTGQPGAPAVVNAFTAPKQPRARAEPRGVDEGSAAFARALSSARPSVC